MNVTKISSVEETPKALEPGDFVSIGGTPAIISRHSYSEHGLRATYLSDGSFHDDFKLGDYDSKRIPKGSVVSVIIK